jgi:hypothetical protein
MSDNQENNLRKYNIGTVKHPFPMMYSFQNEEGRTQFDLGVLQSDENPLRIYSEKDFSQVVGMMYRDMPTPSMLDVFKQGQLQRLPEHKRKVEFFMGDAGAGKSFLANLNAKMRSNKGAMLVDCGGRDLNELIYETVLDYESGKTIYNAIDSKLADGTLNPASVGKLRAALGSAFKEQDGKISIDWEEMGISRADEAKLEELAAKHQKAEGLSADDLKTLDEWDRREEGSKMEEPSKALQAKYTSYKQAIDSDSKKLFADAQTQRDNALAAVREVASLEGLDNGENASIGLKTREGALIRAWKENRPIILDEYNKAKPGTDDALQILWQVFIGEMDRHTVTKGGESFDFDRVNMPNNFFVTLTGNKTRDGYSTRSLSASAYQRLKPHYIEPPKVEDLQHRICQKLTGMPVSTIYKAQEGYWSEHKEQFTDFLIDMRKRGLSDEQQANIPSWQFEMLKNWDHVLKASNQLATLYDRWAQVVDPDSPLHEESKGLGDILGEVDKQFAAEVGVGLRRMMSHMDEAELVVPEAIAAEVSQGVDPSTDWDSSEEIEDDRHEPIEKRYGTRLSKVILKDINDTSVGKDKLLTYMLKQAAEAGLFEMILEEGRSTNDRLIADLLDIDPDKKKEIPENIEEIHAVMCDYLRAKFPDIEADAENTDIISPSALEHVMSQLKGMEEVKRFTTRSGVLHLPSLDLDSEVPLSSAISVESTTLEEPASSAPKEVHDEYNRILEEDQDLKGVPTLESDKLVDAERYLISLAIPSVRENNINALFSPKSHSLTPENDPILQMQQNASETGLSATTLATKTVDADGKARDEFLHVVHDSFGNRNEGRTLVTGTVEISPRLQKALESNGVTYVNRNDEKAADKINAALDDILAGKNDVKESNMCNEHMLTTVLNSRVNVEIVGETKMNNQKVPVFDLPHGEQPLAPQPSVISDELRGKHRENLVSLLSDDRQYIEKAVGKKFPVYLADSPDLDHLKNTVRSLTNDAPQKAAGMGK